MNGHYIQEIISSSVRMGALDCMIENYSNPFLEIFFCSYMWIPVEILELIHARNNISILYIGHLFLLSQSELILWMNHNNSLSHHGIRG